MAEATSKYPRIEIQYCTQCHWMLRAAWFAQELLSTFSNSIGEVALQPATGGTFAVHLITSVDNVADGKVTVQKHLLWDRKAEGGFPEAKELKRRVRDVIDPGRNLGHVDRKKGTSVPFYIPIIRSNPSSSHESNPNLAPEAPIPETSAPNPASIQQTITQNPGSESKFPPTLSHAPPPSDGKSSNSPAIQETGTTSGGIGAQVGEAGVGTRSGENEGAIKDVDGKVRSCPPGEECDESDDR